MLQQSIIGISEALGALCGEVQIPGSGVQIAVPQQFFYGMQVGSLIYQMGSKRVADGVHCVVLALQA